MALLAEAMREVDGLLEVRSSVEEDDLEVRLLAEGEIGEREILERARHRDVAVEPLDRPRDHLARRCRLKCLVSVGELLEQCVRGDTHVAATFGCRGPSDYSDRRRNDCEGPPPRLLHRAPA